MKDKALEFITKMTTRQSNGCLLYRGTADKYPAINNPIGRHCGVGSVNQLVYKLNNEDWDRAGIDIVKTSCGNKRCVEISHIYIIQRGDNQRELAGVEDIEIGYRYYRRGEYIFYSKITKQELSLSKKEYIVEKGKVFHITYSDYPFGEITKVYRPNIGVLKEGEYLC